MRLIELKANDNGGHDNQTIYGTISIPDGWAVIPEDMEMQNFPFGDVEVQDISGIPTVTKWTAGTVPEFEHEPTAQDDTDYMLIDHEYRITMLELGVNE